MQLYGQMNPGKPIPSFPTLLKNMIVKDGPMSVYKGVDAAVTRQLSYGTARLGLHRTFSDMLQKANGGEPISFAQKTASGMASGAIAVCIGTPVDVALVRLQADSMAEPENRKNYKNVVDVSIIKLFLSNSGTIVSIQVHRLTESICSFIDIGARNVGRRCRRFIQRNDSQYTSRNGYECWYVGLLRSSQGSFWQVIG